MAINIKHNLMAANAKRALDTHTGKAPSPSQRLSSGLRIGGPADDPAGLAIKELLRSEKRMLQQKLQEAGDVIAMLLNAGNALQVIDEKLIRLREIAEQAATGIYTDEQLKMLDGEFQITKADIDRIAKATDFNGNKLLYDDHGDTSVPPSGKSEPTPGPATAPVKPILDPAAVPINPQPVPATVSAKEGDADAEKYLLKIYLGTSGDSAEDSYSIKKQDCSAKGLGIADTSTATREQAQKALPALKRAVAEKDKAQAYFGSLQNKLEHTAGDLKKRLEALQAEE